MSFQISDAISIDYTGGAPAPASELVLRCACPACLKAAGLGDRQTGGVTETPGVAGDDIADDNTTTATLDVLEGQAVTSSINHPLDEDWFKVSLTAGQAYEFNLTPTNTSAAGPDLRLELVDSAGNIVASLDGGGMGASESLNFTATATGGYFLVVAGYLPIDIGEYTVSASLDDDDPSPNGGTPLEALDWGGVRVNTDGVVQNGREVIHVYFGKVGEFFGSVDDPVLSLGWQDFAKAAAFVAFEQYENIINIDFVEVGTAAEADFIINEIAQAPVLLGRMRPPEEPNEGVGEFNRLASSWSEGGLQQGGFGFITLIHEFGHGMGLKHPHDNGGGGPIMRGVEGDTVGGYTTGDFGLNAGVFTTMSYNDGWRGGPVGTSDSDNYGYQGTLMALDVAILQQKYGANTSFRTGDDVYLVPGANVDGTMYAAIWDAGGVDTIAAGQAQNVIIDLRAATLQYETGGGGFVSYAAGVYGGYTIANGVLIENAVGGSGTDTITGNAAANRLEGGAGADTLTGGAGDDVLIGGTGVDTASFAVNLADAAFWFFGNTVVLSTAALGVDIAAGIERFVFGDRTIERDAADGVDDLFYLLSNPDVLASGLDADAHYNGGGKAEGRNPNAVFDRAFYLANNGEAVAASGLDPFDHFMTVGWREGRNPSANFDLTQFYAANPLATGLNPLTYYLTNADLNLSRVFALDDTFYLASNPDVLAARLDPVFHYTVAGRGEHRDPNALFDADGYLATYTDVAAAGLDPLAHYLGGGWLEGRDPSTRFDGQAYLDANPDVAGAGYNPLYHYLAAGRFEGRPSYDDGAWG